ncbi:hypothetical protein NIES2119_04915 [[Phormidium ambiguum] IAM M-71]|uniref:Filamentous haemagglutinin FhaB/tRNA nuclease CdiA-like TPS domain-containing protein n=1 Tax=[Phormidium ambiguum] IAM M-71 TaxID=454136 RepID=A0A1U7IQH3_9CYAN|nr:filamentous hemagglutinin N-terminal domain-containing protein [Phormidium ambiguum]OKH39618.1 hypothetical protein NIES2119_04915 [Phormidium ambiguum IAM M-71]
MSESRYPGWKLGLGIAIAFGGAIAFPSNTALAQSRILPDNTLGAESSTVTLPDATTDEIRGGAIRGSNLFHSFLEFNVGEGRAAYFISPNTNILNILARVTGSVRSEILGTLGTRGGANPNLFLINPNGIIFGPNAKLDVSGSFVASTARGFTFADGTFFSATQPQTTPLLTISVPVGLQYGSNAGSLQVQGSQLEVRPDRTLALVGGNVSIDGGQIRTPGGRVELGGLLGEGTVGLSVNNGLSFPQETLRGNVLLTNSSKVEVRAGGGGNIGIYARNIDMLAESGLLAGIASGLGSPYAVAGNIIMNATGAIALDGSVAFNDVRENAVGQAGNIDVITGSLALTNGAQLSSGTIGKGDGGSITIKAYDTVSLNGFNEANSGIFTLVFGEGNGGTIDITTGSLSVTNGAILAASTFGQGNAGTVTITARDTVSFDGIVFEESSDDVIPSATIITVGEGAVGNGGTLEINTGSLFVTNGAELSSKTSGQGNAGNITIRARDRVSFDSGYVYSDVGEDAVGNGGSINITAGRLSLSNGAGLTATSDGNGAAGNIEISADSIRLDNEAEISADTVGGQGNIQMRSPLLILRRNSNITTNARGTNIPGGNIALNTDILAALENSDISANSQDFRGGNITINAQGIFGTQFREAPTPASDITATGANSSLSGSVQINTPDVDPSRGLVHTPIQPVNVQVAQGCQAGGESSIAFFDLGRGGLAPDPYEPFSSNNIWEDVPSTNREIITQPSQQTRTTTTLPDKIVEAQGWVTNEKGEVVLIAKTSSSRSLNPCRLR